LLDHIFELLIPFVISKDFVHNFLLILITYLPIATVGHTQMILVISWSFFESRIGAQRNSSFASRRK